MQALLIALLWAGLGPAEAAEGQAPAGAEANERRPFQSALLATEGLDAEALDAALRLRLPELELHRSWDLEREGDAVAKPYVFIHLAPAGEGPGLSLELITDEGQAYVRALDDEGPRERIAASFVVSILSAIELREVQADRVEVQAPQRAEAETISEAVDAAKGAEPEPKPKLEQPDPEEREPEEPKPEPKSEPKDPEPAPSGWEIGPWVSAGVLLSIPPPDYSQPLAGWGGEPGVLARGPRGLLVGTSVRIHSRVINPNAITRTRVAAHLGWAWRWRAFELPVAGSLGAEAWGARVDGERVTAADLGAQSTLLGLSVWAAPGWFRGFDEGPLAGVRVGGRAEFGVALAPGVGVVGLADAEGDPFVRVGGPEFGVGLDVCLYLRPRVNQRKP